MEGFTYVDIFATKGIIYLLVIGYLVTFVFFWKILNKPESKRSKDRLTGRLISTTNHWFHIAKGFHYHQGHSWAVRDDGNIVKIGIDDFAQKFIGKPAAINLPAIGTRMDQGGYGLQILADSQFINIIAPINGEVVEINEEAIRFPELICEDPYGKGWLMKVRVPNLKRNLCNLITGKVALAWMEDTIHELRNKTENELGPVFQDGGVPSEGFMHYLSPEKRGELIQDLFMMK